MIVVKQSGLFADPGDAIMDEANQIKSILQGLRSKLAALRARIKE
jgi:hypothetical protein